MNDRPYNFRIAVKYPNGKQGVETHVVVESNTDFGEAVAIGKVVRFYDGLLKDKAIKQYRILE